eukprot:CAMPEP_0195149098 /NCGR_PEP_ID=MMETSP0448-20130528/176448_1 /TAXON_ID=66468 /ORGANISM="Heterocapsa triquestra, Strain CCMP 448" /LENGTH=275 /DNA_ID=CAMNT_0040187729 /DNA_START=71 /DNA_END=895 /DNA_ORIENTATION=-
MGLQELLEGLLLQVLGPYVDGVNLGALHNAILRGKVELTNIRVKPEVLAVLGVKGFRIERGVVKSIRLSVPWSSIYTGKISLAIEGISMCVEQVADGSPDEELAAELRNTKDVAIKDHMTHVREQLQRKAKEDASAASEEGIDWGTALVRRIVNNVRAEVRDVQASFQSPILGLAGAVELPQLAVLSTDSEFREVMEDEVLEGTNDSVYTILKVVGFGARLAAFQGKKAPKVCPYILTPASMSLTLAHEPENQRLALAAQLGCGTDNEVTMARSN